MTWEAKVIAAAAAAAATDTAAETNWKHKVTPGWRDLMSQIWSEITSDLILTQLMQVNREVNPSSANVIRANDPQPWLELIEAE